MSDRAFHFWCWAQHVLNLLFVICLLAAGATLLVGTDINGAWGFFWFSLLNKLVAWLILLGIILVRYRHMFKISMSEQDYRDLANDINKDINEVLRGKS